MHLIIMIIKILAICISCKCLASSHGQVPPLQVGQIFWTNYWKGSKE